MDDTRTIDGFAAATEWMTLVSSAYVWKPSNPGGKSAPAAPALPAGTSEAPSTAARDRDRARRDRMRIERVSTGRTTAHHHAFGPDRPGPFGPPLDWPRRATGGCRHHDDRREPAPAQDHLRHPARRQRGAPP